MMENSFRFVFGGEIFRSYLLSATLPLRGKANHTKFAVPGHVTMHPSVLIGQLFELDRYAMDDGALERHTSMQYKFVSASRRGRARLGSHKPVGLLNGSRLHSHLRKPHPATLENHVTDPV